MHILNEPAGKYPFKPGNSMIEKPDDHWWMVMLMMLAIVAGGVGGCAGAAHLFLAKHVSLRLVQVLAYMMLGVFMGLVSLASIIMLKIEVKDVPTLMGFCAALGFGGSLVLSGVNVSVHWISKHFNVELKWTLRRDAEERRDHEDNS